MVSSHDGPVRPQPSVVPIFPPSHEDVGEATRSVQHDTKHENFTHSLIELGNTRWHAEIFVAALGAARFFIFAVLVENTESVIVARRANKPVIGRNFSAWTDAPRCPAIEDPNSYIDIRRNDAEDLKVRVYEHFIIEYCIGNAVRLIFYIWIM